MIAVSAVSFLTAARYDLVALRAATDRVGALPGVVDHGLFRVPLSDVLVGRTDGGCDPAGPAGAAATIRG